MTVLNEFIPEVTQHSMVASSANRGRTFPCTEPKCTLLFQSEAKMTEHVNSGAQHVTVPPPTPAATARDRVKFSWLAGLEGKLEARKQGNASTMISLAELDNLVRIS